MIPKRNVGSEFSILGLFLSCLLLGSGSAAVDYLTEKPSYIQTCKISDPGFTQCSTASIQKLFNKIFEGEPELKQFVGVLDPIVLDKIVFKQDNNPAATFSADITNLSVKGLSGLKTLESRVNRKEFSWQTKVFLPNLQMDGKYAMDGRILLLPLNGKGNIHLEIENIDLLMKSKTVLYEKGDFTFYNVTDVRVTFDMTKARANLDNLFNGRSKEIEKSTNEFFNEHWRDFFEALRPLITETIEKVLMKILKGVFDHIPANFFISDIPTSKELYKN